jgi:hypothetical protein
MDSPSNQCPLSNYVVTHPTYPITRSLNLVSLLSVILFVNTDTEKNMLQRKQSRDIRLCNVVIGWSQMGDHTFDSAFFLPSTLIGRGINMTGVCVHQGYMVIYHIDPVDGDL